MTAPSRGDIRARRQYDMLVFIGIAGDVGVQIRPLARALGVSKETVHADLKTLDCTERVPETGRVRLLVGSRSRPWTP